MSELERVLIIKNKKKKKNFLSKNWRSIKELFKKFFPSRKLEKFAFSGWGMKTKIPPPWNNSLDNNNLNFNNIHDCLIDLIKVKKFRLTQFEIEGADYEKILNELKWRSYVIYNSIIQTVIFSNDKKINIVECGVCDGLTAFYIIGALKFKNKDFKFFLYDSWSQFKHQKDKDIFDYSYLDVEVVKKNLAEYSEYIIFNEGNIPEVFDKVTNPENINWLHIDLNSEEATKHSLNFFYEKLNSNGIIIFDDYGGLEETRKTVDIFLKDKSGHFLSLPTGQGVFIKK